MVVNSSKLDTSTIMTSIMNEMGSGCCVCSDERGWTENPLVYCDGVGCNIGVHKACYGIVTVPSGNWYCRKCESQERSARVRCELCPSRDGALKRTDNNGWAHVVCGLYIPEVRFGSVTTMEPILLSQIPAERFNKICYICEQNNRGRASMGACMQCNKAGCKQQFHVTCAQTMGLLCEEPGNYLDNVKYCGYCQEHYMKLRKNSNVKTIPPYKPASTNNSGSDESPDKKCNNFSQSTTDLKQTTKRKSVGSRPSVNGPTRLSGDSKEVHQPNVDHVNGNRNVTTPSPNAHLPLAKERTPTPSVVPAVSVASTSPHGAAKNDTNSRFTTSNFVESVITPSESVFADVSKNRKRKINDTNNPLPSLPLPSMLVGQSSQQALPVTSMSPPASSEPEHSNSKLSSNQDDDNDDDDSGDLKFIEEPNLSTLKPTPGNPLVSTSESTNGVSSVISSVSTSMATSLVVNLSANNTSVNQTPVNTSTTVKTSSTNVKSHQNMSSTKPATSSYLSASSSNTPETKIAKFQNNSTAPHMLGNRLNPASSMAQKMFDSLNDELEAHSIFTPNDVGTNANTFVGPPLYNKIISSTRAKEAAKRSNSPSNGAGAGPLASLSGSAANFPQTLEELLEKQWEQGGTFLMEQAQHFDIASLLTCLHKLREENLELEEHIRKLKARRDHLLGVNARLAMPLAPISQLNNIHSSSQSHPSHASALPSQPTTHLSHQMMHPSQQQSSAHQPTNVQQQQQQQPSLPPPMHHNVSHSQPHYHPTNVSTSAANSNLSENNQLRNMQLPSNMYLSPASGNLRGSHGPVYQNSHSMENGLISHHQHTRNMAAMSTAANIRHHSSTPNASMYVTSQHGQQQQQQQQQQSNPGVVVRTPNLPVSEVGRMDRRNPAVMSNY